MFKRVKHTDGIEHRWNRTQIRIPKILQKFQGEDWRVFRGFDIMLEHGMLPFFQIKRE